MTRAMSSETLHFTFTALNGASACSAEPPAGRSPAQAHRRRIVRAPPARHPLRDRQLEYQSVRIIPDKCVEYPNYRQAGRRCDHYVIGSNITRKNISIAIVNDPTRSRTRPDLYNFQPPDQSRLSLAVPANYKPTIRRSLEKQYNNYSETPRFKTRRALNGTRTHFYSSSG